MAGKTRTFWIIPGEVDPKNGKQIEHQTKPNTGILGSGFGPAIGGTAPVEVHEETTPDGEFVQTVADEKGNFTQEIGRGVDTGLLALSTARGAEANRVADNARADLARQPAPQTPDQARITAAQATTAERAAKPEMIQTTAPTPGTNAAVDDPRSATTSSVTKTQFDADRSTAADARQAQEDLLKHAKDAQDKIRQDAIDKIANDRWTAEQAKTLYDKQMDQLTRELAVQTAALTARSQEISLRGQDISAGTAQRGQDMSYATGLAGEMGADRRAKAQFWNAPGQIESTNSLMAGGPPVATRPSRGPFADDAAMVSAQQAQAMVPGQFQLPGAPPPVPPMSPYVLRPAGT